MSRTGSTFPSLWGMLGSSKQRNTWIKASMVCTSASSLLPTPCPPLLKPGRSTISTVAGTMRLECEMLSMSFNRSSTTSHMPMLDFDAKPISALVFDMQLNMVVLPVLDKPMIPQFSAIMEKFLQRYEIKTYLQPPNRFVWDRDP